MPDLELWVGFGLQVPFARYFTDTAPGFPEDEQPAEPPPYEWRYRQLPPRRPMPANGAVFDYGVSLLFKTGSSVAKTFRLGDSSNWRGRPDAAARLAALQAQTPPTEPDALAEYTKRLVFAEGEAAEEYGYNQDRIGELPEGGINPPFTVGYAAFSQAFTADSDANTFTITEHGLETGDGPLMFVAGQGVLPGGVEAGTKYWAIVVDADTIKVALSESDAESNIEVNLINPGTPDETRKLNGLNQWREGILYPPRTPGQYAIAVQVEELSPFEPFDSTDTETYKVTTEPTFDSPETTMPAFRIGASKQTALVMLVPQWRRFEISFIGYWVIKWASPNFRIGIEKRVEDTPAPSVEIVSTPGNLSGGTYFYAVASESDNGTISRIGFPTRLDVTDPMTESRARISDISVGPPGTVKRHIYRTTVNQPDDFRADFKFLTTINNNDFDQEYEDNTADGGLGATAPLEFPFAFGNSKVGDWFVALDGVTYDPETGAYSGGLDNKDAGFYHCTIDGGDDWDAWQFCAADAVTPPDPGCFDPDRIRYRQAQIERTFTIPGYKKALSRPVFTRDSREYGTSAFSPAFPRNAFEYQPGVPFEDEPRFEETTPATLEAISYESIFAELELDKEEARRTYNRWAENSLPYQRYFQLGVFGEQPFGKYFVDLGYVAAPDSALPDGDLFSEIAAVDASFDIEQAQSDPTAGEHVFLLPPSLGNMAFGHWWSKEGKLSVWRADSPAGSLVGAVKIGNEIRYLWRKVDSTGRTTQLIDNQPYDSTEDSISYSALSGEDSIPRRTIRSESDDPPEAGVFDFEF